MAKVSKILDHRGRPIPVDVPRTGEQTGQQTGHSSLAVMFDFAPAPAGTYDTYRQMSSHPTVALVMSIATAPIRIAGVTFHKAHDGVPDLWLKVIERTMNNLWLDLVNDGLRALEFGWTPWEKVWNYRTLDLGFTKFPAMVIDRLKPLIVDSSKFWIDDTTRNVLGITNTIGENVQNLAWNKCAVFIYDNQPGYPYGRPRHENIRGCWSEAEQLRKNLAGYMGKTATIIPIVKYPEGTSKDPSGADRPNQWHAQALLDNLAAKNGVLMPNGVNLMNYDDAMAMLKAAKMSTWDIDFYKAEGADHAPGMVEVMQYYDTQIFAGWLRPARSGLESKHGSRADAGEQMQNVAPDNDAIYSNITSMANRQLVDDELVQNFGEAARGMVYAKPTLIADVASQNVLKVVTAMLQTQQGGKLTDRIDLDALLTKVSIPLKQVAAQNPEVP